MRRPACWGTRASRHVASCNERFRWGRFRSSHIVVVRILPDVADVENDCFLAEILPPVRGTKYFGADVAGLMRYRHFAIAGIFDDFALLDENQGGPIVMAVPGHDTAGLYGEPAKTQLAALNMGGLLAQIDRAQ